LAENFAMVEKHNSKIFAVEQDIKLKLKLLDTKIIKGVYID